MTITIYTKGLSEDLLPKIKKRFTDFQMDVDFHPAFTFNQKGTGFLPIKLKVQPGYSVQYDNLGYDIVTGFERHFSNYNYEEDLKAIQLTQIPEKKSFLSKLFGGSKPSTQNMPQFVADSELDPLLKNCDTYVNVSWKSQNKSELRVSLFFAAILAELTEGVIYDTYNGRYLSGAAALQLFPEEIKEYEQSFPENEFTVPRFEGWKN